MSAFIRQMSPPRLWPLTGDPQRDVFTMFLHRLDVPSSGLVLVARTHAALRTAVLKGQLPKVTALLKGVSSLGEVSAGRANGGVAPSDILVPLPHDQARGGAALPSHCAATLHAPGISAACTYGQTETAGPVMLGEVNGDLNALRPIGGAAWSLSHGGATNCEPAPLTSATYIWRS